MVGVWGSRASIAFKGEAGTRLAATIPGCDARGHTSDARGKAERRLPSLSQEQAH